ncbi:MAG: helix-turn-helix domain-containing protein [Steroidobacteraceae bacterium]
MTPKELRDLRIKLGQSMGGLAVTQEMLAAWLHVAANTVARWERGERRIPHWAEKEAYRIAGNWDEAFALAEPTPPPLLDKRRIRQLLQLCHPDKHDGSKAAHDVTAWLNSLRD